KVTAPVPEPSSVAPLGAMVNSRSVLDPLPVYLSVPPLISRLLAALLELPIGLAVPPLARDGTCRVELTRSEAGVVVKLIPWAAAASTCAGLTQFPPRVVVPP